MDRCTSSVAASSAPKAQWIAKVAFSLPQLLGSCGLICRYVSKECKWSNDDDQSLLGYAR